MILGMKLEALQEKEKERTFMKKDNLILLTEYLRRNNTWVSADELASFLHTSTRTIRNYIQEINNQSSSQIPLIQSGAQGYRWHMENYLGQKIYSLSTSYEFPPIGREYYVIRKLLYNDCISVDTLLNILAISESTLEQDLSKIRAIIKGYHLSIHLKRNTFRLLGKEIDLRRLSIDCIKKSCRVELLTTRFVEIAFPHIKVKSIIPLLEECLGKYHLYLNGYNQGSLLLLVIIQLDRIIHQHSIIKEEFSIPCMEQYPDYYAAKEFSSILGKLFDCHYNNWETAYLMTLLISRTDYMLSENKLDIPAFDAFYELAVDSLAIGSRYLELDFSKDGFPHILTHFIMRMDVRQKMLLSTPNPLAPHLRSVHPLLMDISSKMMFRFSRAFSIGKPSDEVGTLALLLSDYLYERFPFESRLNCTLVCPSFFNLADKIAKQLQSSLNHVINIDKIVTTTDIEALSAKTDFIISVLPIKSNSHTVIISPMPNSGDYRHIMEEAHIIKEIRRREYLTAYLRAYLSPGLFSVDVPYKSKEAAIHDACRRLLEEGAVEDGFEEAVLEREKMDTTAFMDMVALPHVCSKLVKKNSLRIVLNHTPIPWGTQKAYMMILIALEEDLLVDFQHSYGLFVSKFSNPKIIMTLLKSTDYDSFMELIETEI